MEERYRRRNRNRALRQYNAKALGLSTSSTILTENDTAIYSTVIQQTSQKLALNKLDPVDVGARRAWLR